MKKFLSLVLAMIMTLSLVTISAGATEYKDLTDKDEIQYEEAVAVLNRIGVITGYEDGTFRPETELTRGAAAKIIVSLMIGPDAAGALSNNTSPYPDVPAGHTFAGVISYCKTAGYISGYGDGNFKPAGTLTGYAFSKMLLGALGYKSDIEGFVDTGWTNNVARIGNVAGLFDRISFDGAAAVNRDQACQLALNTLKATMVTYDKTTITGATGTYVMQGEAVPVTSNNRDINANIGRKDWYGGNNKGSDYLTLEFGEEHFKDLRLEYDRFDPAHDKFGRPSNEWSYKKVTIGTFPLEADRTYTTQVAHVEDSDGTKEKNLNLRNYDLEADGGYSVWTGWGNTGAVTAKAGDTTVLWMNGLKDEDYFDQVKDSKTNKKVADIADFTDNGTLVEVYVSEVDADWITDVVVIQTQLMEVDKVASNYVSLKQQEPDVEKGNPNGTPRVGFNQAAIDVEIEDVKDDNEDCYTILKGLKSGDDIAVVPVTTDSGKTYDAAEVYVPETVSGTWTRVDTYGKIVDKESQRSAISITVGGTEYKLADWNDKMYDKTDADIKATRKDVTLIMDKYGNAMKAKDIGDTTGFMVIGNFYQSLVGSKISTFVHGWDINGKEIDLNLGSNVKYQNHNSVSGYGHELGELVRYDSKAATGDADYALTHANVHSVFYYLNDNNIDTVNPNFETKKNTLRLPLSNTHAAWSDGSGVETANSNGHFCNDAAIRDDIAAWDGKNVDDLYTRYTFADDVKFIYVTYDGDDEVDSVEFKDGRQNVDTKEFAQKLGKDFIYSAQASVKDDKITSVVIKQESADASLNRMLYVINYTGFNEYDRETGRTGIGVLVARFTTDGKFEDEVEMIVDKNLAIGAFASYNDTGSTTINGKEIDHYYHVKTFTRHNSNPAVLFADYSSKVHLKEDGAGKISKYLLRLHDVQAIDANGNATGPILVADPGADGEGANDATESYLMSKYRSHGSVVDDAFNDAEGIIWTNDAQWLNVTKVAALDKVDSTEDLNDFMDDNDATVELTVLLNENPDSDDFRVAYLIVLTEVHYNKTVAPVTGDVRFLDDDKWPTDVVVDSKYYTTDVQVRDGVKVGDTFRVSTRNGAAINWDHLEGVTYQADKQDENAWFFTVTNIPVKIYIKAPAVAPTEFTVTVTIDGVSTDVKVSSSDPTYTFTAPEDGSYTVDGGEPVDILAGESVKLTITKNTKIVFTKKGVEPVGGVPTLNYDGANGITGVVKKASDGSEVNAGNTLAEGELFTVELPAGSATKPNRAVVVKDGAVVVIGAEGYAFADGMVVYVQQGKLAPLTAGDEGFDDSPDAPPFQMGIKWPAVPAAEALSADLLLHAGAWVSLGFFETDVCGVKTLTELFTNGSVFGFNIPAENIPTVSEAITKAVDEDTFDIDFADEGADRAFVNVSNTKSLEIPAVDGEPQAVIGKDEAGNVTLTAKPGVPLVVNGAEVPAGETVVVDENTEKVEIGQVENVKLTINGENVTVKVNGEDYTLGEEVEVVKGSEVTLVISPLEGYEIDKVSGATAVADAENTWTIASIAADRTVTVTTLQKTDMPVKFKPAGAKTIVNGTTGMKTSDLQSDVDWTITKDTDTEWTVKLTGTLNFIGGFVGWNSAEDTGKTSGWFVDFIVDQSENKRVTKTEVKGVTADYREVTTTSKLSNDVTMRIEKDNQNKMRFIKVTLDNGNTRIINVDLSGLTLKDPEQLSITAIKADDYKTENKLLSSKKVSDIQENVQVNVSGEGGSRTVKLTGKLTAVTAPWAQFAASGSKDVAGTNCDTGYMVAVNMKKVISSTTLTAFNDKGKNSASGSGTVSGATLNVGTTDEIVVFRVADTKGNKAQDLHIVASDSSLGRIDYVFDLTDLECVPYEPLTFEVPKATTAVLKTSSKYKAADIQDNLTVELAGDDIIITGTVKAVTGMDVGGFATADQDGYFVYFNAKVDVPGVKYVSMAGPKGDGTTKLDITSDYLIEAIIRYAGISGETENPGVNTLTLLDKDNKVLKEFNLVYDLTVEPAALIEVGPAPADALYAGTPCLSSGKDKEYMVSDLQDVTFSADHENHVVTISGTLNHVKGWAGWTSIPEDQSGWYLTWSVKPGKALGSDAALKVSTERKADVNVKSDPILSTIIRNDTDSSDAPISIKAGDVEYEVVLNLTLLDTEAVPTGVKAAGGSV